MACKGRTKGSVTDSAGSGGAASAAAEQEDVAHTLYKQLEQGMAIAPMAPEADKLVSSQRC